MLQDARSRPFLAGKSAPGGFDGDDSGHGGDGVRGGAHAVRCRRERARRAGPGLGVLGGLRARCGGRRVSRDSGRAVAQRVDRDRDGRLPLRGRQSCLVVVARARCRSADPLDLRCAVACSLSGELSRRGAVGAPAMAQRPRRRLAGWDRGGLGDRVCRSRCGRRAGVGLGDGKFRCGGHESGLPARRSPARGAHCGRALAAGLAAGPCLGAPRRGLPGLDRSGLHVSAAGGRWRIQLQQFGEPRLPCGCRVARARGLAAADAVGACTDRWLLDAGRAWGVRLGRGGGAGLRPFRESRRVALRALVADCRRGAGAHRAGFPRPAHRQRDPPPRPSPTTSRGCPTAVSSSSGWQRRLRAATRPATAWLC